MRDAENERPPHVNMSGFMQSTEQMLNVWEGVVLLGNRGLGSLPSTSVSRSFSLDPSCPRTQYVLILTGLVKPCPYRHNDWGEEGPAELPPDAGPGANHLLDVVIESVDTCDIWSENRRNG